MMQHLAVVMDGNRRWAKKNHMEVFLGHSRGGVQALETTVEFCLERGIVYLSVYAFSLENLKRTEQEKKFLFHLIVSQAQNLLEKSIKNGIKIKFVGDRALFPQEVLKTAQELEKATENNTKLHLNILFCYGGRQEIVAGVKTIVEKLQQGLLKPADISEKTFEESLWMAGVPSPDLVIRTGGVKRLSNFLLYQAAYSELCFLDCFWPEITKGHLEQAVAEFLQIKRNFGV